MNKFSLPLSVFTVALQFLLTHAVLLSLYIKYILRVFWGSLLSLLVLIGRIAVCDVTAQFSLKFVLSFFLESLTCDFALSFPIALNLITLISVKN